MHISTGATYKTDMCTELHWILQPCDIAPGKRSTIRIFFLFLYKSVCCGYSFECLTEGLLMITYTYVEKWEKFQVFGKKKKIPALEPCYRLTLVMLNNVKMPYPLLIFSQSDYLINVVDTNSNTEWQTVQNQISWLLQKPTDLDLHCLQKAGYIPAWQDKACYYPQTITKANRAVNTQKQCLDILIPYHSGLKLWTNRFNKVILKYVLYLNIASKEDKYPLLQKPTDLDLHCLQRQGISRFSRTRVNIFSYFSMNTYINSSASQRHFNEYP